MSTCTRRTFCTTTASLGAAVLGAASLGAASLLGGCGPNQTDSNFPAGAQGSYNKAALRVFHRGTVGEAPLYVAQHKGFFSKYGIDATFEQQPDDLKEAFEKSGYIAMLAEADFLLQIHRGVSAQLLSGVHSGSNILIKAKGTNTNDLNPTGIRVGTENAGSAAEIASKAAIARAGYDFGQAVWTSQSSSSKVLTQFLEGTVQAAALSDMWAGVATKFFEAQTVFDGFHPSPDEGTTCGFLAGNTAIAGDDELSGRLCAAVNEACNWIQQHPEDAITLIKGEGYLVDVIPLLVDWRITPSAEEVNSLYTSVLKNYYFGDLGKDSFNRSVMAQWQDIKAAGMMPSGRVLEDLAKACVYYGLQA